MAQYVIVPFGLLVALAVVSRRERSLAARIFAGGCFMAHLLAGVSVLHRGYFSSLGF